MVLSPRNHQVFKGGNFVMSINAEFLKDYVLVMSPSGEHTALSQCHPLHLAKTFLHFAEVNNTSLEAVFTVWFLDAAIDPANIETCRTQNIPLGVLLSQLISVLDLARGIQNTVDSSRLWESDNTMLITA
jgi:hypothetical protein